MCISNESMAIQFNGLISHENGTALASFKIDKIITLEYPSKYTTDPILDISNPSIEFTLNSSDNSNGLKNVLDKINELFSLKDQSQAKFDSAILQYKASVIGGPSNATLYYDISLVPKVSNLIVDSNQTSSLFDVGWRSFAIEGPLIVNTQEYGPIDINYPYSALEKMSPSLVSKIKDTSLTEVVNEPLLNFERFSEPVSKWKFTNMTKEVASNISNMDMIKINPKPEDGTSYSFYDDSNSNNGRYLQNLKYGLVDGFSVRAASYLLTPSGYLQIDGQSHLIKKGDAEYISAPKESSKSQIDLPSKIFSTVIQYYPAVTLEFISDSTVVLKGDEKFMLKSENDLRSFWKAIDTVKQFGFSVDEITESGLGSVGNPTRFYAVMSLDVDFEENMDH
ncbi:hypothetical protein [Candidatus Nitrosocosmicus sp. SS]|uniref:hypothetical protein n=1 Tax=Candidatus Nitrosocosmicus agrestis TaxID=2563600 RepID=UPI001331A312|nr:hypothetical protein [Candidatus Nitrosocosmicus sp. SS]